MSDDEQSVDQGRDCCAPVRGAFSSSSTVGGGDEGK